MGCTHREGDGVCFDCRDGDELQRLAAENASLREAGRQVEAELEQAKKVIRVLLSVAASERYWRRRYADAGSGAVRSEAELIIATIQKAKELVGDRTAEKPAKPD